MSFAMTRTLLATAAFGLVALVEGRAQATVGVTITTAAITRQAVDGSTYECTSRGGCVGCIVESKYQGIGHQDCLDDTQLVFPLLVSGLPDTTVSMVVAAGTGDCTQPSALISSSASCWIVAPPPTPQPTMSVIVRVADIAQWLGQSGTTLPVNGYVSTAATTACANSSAGTTTTTDDAGNTTTTAGESTVNIFFMFFTNGTVGSASPVAYASYPVKVKLIGPAACSGVSAGSGDGILLVTWTPPAGDTTIQGYDLYAVPVGATGGDSGTQQICTEAGIIGTPLLDDAGQPVFDDAGNEVYVDDAGNPVTEPDASCFTQVNPPPVATCSGTPTVDVSGITCGTANSCDGGGATSSSGAGTCTQVNGTTNASGTITGVTNGTSYDVAVAAFDQFGNTGSISGAACATPAPINDFWKTYNGDGGNAFCALDVVGRGGGSMAAALLALAGLVYSKRRRRHGPG
jgi:hypothetical protein